VHATLHGDLGTIIEWTAAGNGKNRGGTSPPGLSVSAETGTQLEIGGFHFLARLRIRSHTSGAQWMQRGFEGFIRLLPHPPPMPVEPFRFR